MRHLTGLSRADLLACMRDYGDAELDAFAAALGYGLPAPQVVKPEPLGLSLDLPPPAVTHRPDMPPAAPNAIFYRVTELGQTTETVTDEPEWYRRAEPLEPHELRAAPAARPPAQLPLMPWSRLWPFLKVALGAQLEDQALDIPLAVHRLARGQALQPIPRQRYAGWGDSCHVVIDYAAPLLPFWADFNDLHRRLRRLRGGQGMTVFAFPDGDPMAPCWVATSKGWRTLGRYPVPSAQTRILVLSDLGCLDPSDGRRRQWQRFARRLQRVGCRPVALMPCPPRWWSPEVSRGFEPVGWDWTTRPPRRLKGRRARWPELPYGDRENAGQKLLSTRTEVLNHFLGNVP